MVELGNARARVEEWTHPGMDARRCCVTTRRVPARWQWNPGPTIRRERLVESPVAKVDSTFRFSVVLKGSSLGACSSLGALFTTSKSKTFSKGTVLQLKYPCL